MKPDPSEKPNYLPNNLPECHKLITDLRQEIKSLIADTVTQLQQRVAELEKQLRRRNRKIFGKSSAKVPAALLTGTGKAVYDQNSSELEDEKANLKIAPEEKKNGGGGRTAPKNAPKQRKVEHKITCPEALACPGCSKPRQVMGFELQIY